MAPETTAIHRAADQEAIAPLLELCKAGRLFDVQAWIEAGHPVNPPPPPAKGQRPKSPLEYAIDRGFHSLVQVLLEGGAVQEPEGSEAPIYRALRARRFDMVQLLVEHGFDPKTVDMREVFRSWDRQIMEYFIERGAEIHEGHPFAAALCDRVRTALGLFKRYREQMPELQEQADLALRHHCREGNLKWVSLMLWAGGDPFTRGIDEPDEELEEGEERLSGVEWAAFSGRFEIFDLKPIRTKLPGPHPGQVLPLLTRRKGIEILKRLLATGIAPNDQENGGCSAISYCLEHMSWPQYFASRWEREARSRKMDTEDSRDYLKSIHLLVKHGARWRPADKQEVEEARRALLRLIPDYTIEVVWIMSKYQACTRDCIEQLLRTSAIKRHIADHRPRLRELLATWD